MFHVKHTTPKSSEDIVKHSNKFHKKTVKHKKLFFLTNLLWNKKTRSDIII